jgi:hypothetical protein
MTYYTSGTQYVMSIPSSSTGIPSTSGCPGTPIVAPATAVLYPDPISIGSGSTTGTETFHVATHGPVPVRTYAGGPSLYGGK